MTNNVGENLKALFTTMENYITTKMVVGDAVHFGDVILVPLVEVSFGVGTGVNEKASAGQAGGGGLGARLVPAAVIVIIKDTVQLVNVKDKDGVNKLIDMVPGVLSKLNLDGLFSKKDKKDKDAAAPAAAETEKAATPEGSA
jgi:uncharacterized spore protein YtfJ